MDTVDSVTVPVQSRPDRGLQRKVVQHIRAQPDLYDEEHLPSFTLLCDLPKNTRAPAVPIIVPKVASGHASRQLSARESGRMRLSRQSSQSSENSSIGSILNIHRKSTSRAILLSPQARASFGRISELRRPSLNPKWKPDLEIPNRPMWRGQSIEEEICMVDEKSAELDRAANERRKLKQTFRTDKLHTNPIIGSSTVPIDMSKYSARFAYLPNPLGDRDATEQRIRADDRDIAQTIKNVKGMVSHFSTSRKQATKLRTQFEAYCTKSRKQDANVLKQMEKEKLTKSMQLRRAASSLTQGIFSSDPAVEIVDSMAKAAIDGFFKSPKNAATYFQVNECVSEEDRIFRARAKSLGMTFLRADDLRREFRILDVENRGKINLDGFGKIVGIFKFGRGQAVPEWELLAIWNRINKDADGSVTFDTVLQWAAT